ncbi:serA, partial [Symbiodinium pilosum]
RTLAVLGTGYIGREVIRRALAFRMHVRAWSRSLTAQEASELGAEFCPTPDAAADGADALSVHLALGKSTRNLVGAGLLAKLRPGALVVNLSRGGVVDEEALLDAVKARGIRAGLDVFEREPGANDTKFQDKAIMEVSGIYGTHHTGARTEQASEAVEDAVVAAVDAYLSGREIPGRLA